MQSMSILDHIGNTPLVEVSRMSPKPGVRIFAKLEGLNPSGSIKDRVAKYLVQQAEASGALTPGQTLVEASTGNTALALALIAKQKGYRLKVVIPHRATPGVADLLATYDAEIVWCDPLAGMRGAIELARQLGQEEGCFNTRQFESEANIAAHYETTGPEILKDLPDVDAFVAGIGTGGTLMGVGRRLRERNPEIRVIGVEPRMGEQLQDCAAWRRATYRPCWTWTSWTAGSWWTAPRPSSAPARCCKRRAYLPGCPPGPCCTAPSASLSGWTAAASRSSSRTAGGSTWLRARGKRRWRRA